MTDYQITGSHTDTLTFHTTVRPDGLSTRHEYRVTRNVHSQIIRREIVTIRYSRALSIMSESTQTFSDVQSAQAHWLRLTSAQKKTQNNS